VNDTAGLLDALAAQAHADGGWAYAPGQLPHIEPTCLALLALSVERARFQTEIQRGLAFLQQNRLADGSFRLTRGRQEAVWPTSLALFAQAVLGVPATELRPAALRLLSIEGKTVDDPEVAHQQDIDIRIPGWPWGEGNFSWVEPTAWACLALRRAGYADHPRVAAGQRLLLDRAFDTGGINYGNRRIFGRMTEPGPGPTALMLLALQGHAEHPRITAANAYLQANAPAANDIEHLCWAKLALHAQGQDVAKFDALIAQARSQRTEAGLFPVSLMREALAALALSIGHGNPFLLAGAAAPEQPPAVVPTYKLPGKSLGERFKSWTRGLAVQAATNLRVVAPQSQVHITRETDYNADLASTLGRMYDAFRVRVPLKGKRVVLKPNLVEYHRDKVINTHPHVIAAVIELCRREGAAEVIVAEGPGHWRNVEYLVSASGLGDVLRHYKVPFIDLNHDEPVKLPNMGRATGMEFLYLSRTIAAAEVVISLPKLKTHHWAGTTLSLKNLFGTLPGICYGWPKNELHWRGIDNSVVDIALTRTPELAIVDGIIGMEGDGPLNGTARPLGALIMGDDLLAVDATCCRLMKLNPQKVGYLQLGAAKKLGMLAELGIEQLGETIAALAQPFETLPDFHELYMGRTA